MSEIQLENLDVFVSTSKKIDEHRSFILNESIDSLIVGLKDQEIDEPDYTPIILSVSELIQYNGLILIGALSGYFPKDLTDKIITEIIRFLEIGPISEYYSLRNKLPIGNGILAYTIAVNNGDTELFYKNLYDETDEEGETSDFFNEFLALFYSFKKNQDIKIFLKIFDFYESLESQIKLERIQTMLSSDFELEKALNSDTGPILGALNFLEFSSELKYLFIRAQGTPVLQSSLWYFYSNYYGNRAKELFDFYNKLLDVLELKFNQSKEKIDFLEKLNQYYKDGNLITESDLKKHINNAREDIAFLCDKNSGQALKAATESIFERYGVFEYA